MPIKKLPPSGSFCVTGSLTLCRQLIHEFCSVDQKTFVRTGADGAVVIAGSYLKGQLASIDGYQLAVAIIFLPSSVAASCVVSILMPTLLVEESRHGTIALQAAAPRATWPEWQKHQDHPLPITAATLVVSTIASARP